MSSSPEIALYKHRVESELRRQRAAWLETILNHMADGVIVTDDAGKVQFLNASAEKLTGWKAAQANKSDQLAGSVLPLVEPELDLRLDEFLPDSITRAVSRSFCLPAISSLNLAGDSFPVQGAAGAQPSTTAKWRWER